MLMLFLILVLPAPLLLLGGCRLGGTRFGVCLLVCVRLWLCLCLWLCLPLPLRLCLARALGRWGLMLSGWL
ncbi:hypothetical protein BJY00DRAFT_277832, partial [Aspergillus carlsbadensis]